MPQVLIAVTVGLYAVLGLLLLSLNIVSLWRWWVKAGAIVVTVGCVAATYVTITALLGWPSDGKLPDQFHLVATRIVEPDRAAGKPGEIFLWVEAVDANMLPISEPRGYRLPFSASLADRTDAAQKRIASGDDMLGTASEIEDAGDLADPNGHQTDEAEETGSNVGLGANVTGSTSAVSATGSAQGITFREMPAMHLPTKQFDPTSE